MFVMSFYNYFPYLIVHLLKPSNTNSGHQEREADILDGRTGYRLPCTSTMIEMYSTKDQATTPLYIKQ